MSSRQDLLAKRPTSPHLSIYKWQISSVLSILHRMTGAGIFLALCVISWILIYINFTNDFHLFQKLFTCDCTRWLLIALSYATIYHFLNGIRHLFWDIGLGFSKCEMNTTGWLVIVLSFVLTFSFWFFII